MTFASRRTPGAKTSRSRPTHSGSPSPVVQEVTEHAGLCPVGPHSESHGRVPRYSPEREIPLREVKLIRRAHL